MHRDPTVPMLGLLLGMVLISAGTSQAAEPGTSSDQRSRSAAMTSSPAYSGDVDTRSAIDYQRNSASVRVLRGMPSGPGSRLCSAPGCWRPPTMVGLRF